MKFAPYVAFVLAVMLLLCWITRPSGPVKDTGRDSHIDSAATIKRMDSTAIATADTVLAREARRDTAEWAKDSALAKLARRNDSLDVLAAVRLRQKRAAQISRDSLVAVVDSMTQPSVPPGVLDTITVSPEELAGDSALSCESRYAGRLQQLSLLGDALERCRARGDTVRQTLIGVRDTLLLTKTYLGASDSLLRWERDRPRPCQVDLWIKKVGCGTAMGGTAVVTSILWLVVRR